ncbi:MAG: tetratricopeptide repeat protein [Desulfosoma sp.]
MQRTTQRMGALGQLKALSALVASFVILSLFSACSSREEKIAQFLRSGDAYMEKGDLDRAVIQYKNALQIDPQHVPATFALGRAYLAQKERDRAYGAFKRALELDPAFDEARLEAAALAALSPRAEEALKDLDQIKDPARFEPRVSTVRAQALLALGRAEEAAAVAEKILAEKPSKDSAVVLAFAYEKLGKTEPFQSAVGQWRALDPQDPYPYIVAARYAARANQRDEALRQLTAMGEVRGKDPSVRLLQAKTLEEFGFIDEAGAAFDALPEEPAYQKEKAQFRLRHSQIAEARKILENLLAQNPKDTDAAILLSLCLFSLKDVEGALATLDAALPHAQSAQSRENVLLTKASILISQQRLEPAKTICQEVLKENPSSAQAHFLLGKSLLREKNFEAAELHLNQAATALPKDPESQLLLAQAQLALGKPALSIDTLKQALERVPESTPIRMALLEQLVKAQRFPEAIQVLEKALDREPDNPVWVRARGQVKAALKDLDAAEADFQRLVALRPDSPIGYMELGRLYYARNDLQKAEGAFRRAAQIEPRWPDPYRALSAVLKAQGRMDEAVKEAQAAYAQNPTPGLGMHLAALYEYQGRYAKAAAVYEDFLEKWEETPEILNNLAFLYTHRDSQPQTLARAEELIRRALESSPENPAFLDTMAVIAHKQGRLDEAWHMIGKALEKDPEIAEHNLHAAQIARDRGDPVKAAEYARKALEKGLPPHLEGEARQLLAR